MKKESVGIIYKTKKKILMNIKILQLIEQQLNRRENNVSDVKSYIILIHLYEYLFQKPQNILFDIKIGWKKVKKKIKKVGWEKIKKKTEEIGWKKFEIYLFCI